MRHPSRPSLLLRLLCVATFLWALACAEPPPDPDLLALWQGGEIRIGDVDRFLLSQPVTGRFPSEEQDTGEWLRQRIDTLFEIEISRAEEAEGAELLDGNADFIKAVDAHEKALLRQHFMDRKDQAFEVTLDQARAYFDRHQEALQRPEKRSFRHLLKAFPEGGDAATREQVCAQAESLRRQVVAGASFDALVREHSDSANAGSGGLIAGIARTDLRGEVGRLVFSMEAGEVSRVLRTRAGCQIFSLQQIMPALQPSFDLLQAQIVEAIAGERRQAWRLDLLREVAAELGAELPPQLVGEGEPIRMEDLLFELGEEAILGQDVARAVTPERKPIAALQFLIERLLFSAALKRELGAEEIDELVAPGRRQLRYQWAKRQSLLAFVTGQPLEELQEFYDQRADHYLSEPAVEVTIFSWPIAAGDPIDSLRRPRQLWQAMASGAAPDAAWPAFEGDSGVERELLPETPLRKLIAARPELAGLFVDKVEEGQAIGPVRAGPRIYLGHVDVMVPSRKLSLLEARKRVERDYLEQNLSDLGRAWRDQLKEKYGFEVYAANLDLFGSRLIEELQSGTIQSSAPAGAAVEGGAIPADSGTAP